LDAAYHTWDTAAEAAALRRAFERASRTPRPKAGRDLLQRAQAFLVSVRREVIEHAGSAVPLIGDIWAWEGHYDGIRGLNAGDPVAEALVI